MRRDLAVSPLAALAAAGATLGLAGLAAAGATPGLAGLAAAGCTLGLAGLAAALPGCIDARRGVTPFGGAPLAALAVVAGPAGKAVRRRGRGRARAAARALALLALVAAALPARAQTAGRGFRVFIAGFDDVNGNGVLDCGEPVTVEVGYFDTPQDPTAAITGHLVALVGGTSGLAFLSGTVQQDYTLSAGGCQGVVTEGNGQSDPETQLDFSCAPPSAYPVQGNAIVWKFKAVFTGRSPSLTAVAHGTTSDGLDQTPGATKSDQIGAVCSGGGGTPTVNVGKTAAGSGAPGSVIVYTLSVTDTSGLGVGGAQLTDTVPDQTTFDAAASSAGWFCPAPTPGSLCTLPLGNVPPYGTVTRFFAATIASPLPAGVSVIANAACARQGPSLVLGCASTTTPTTGAPVLKIAKSLRSGGGAPGGTLVYQLAVANTGNQGSGPLTLRETVPDNTRWNAGASAPGWSCAGSGPGASCTLALAGVPAGGSTSTLFAVTIANPLPAGVTAVTNTACIAGTQTCGSATTPTSGMPALAVHKSLAGTATPGATLTYTIAIQNTGNEGASGVAVTDQVPQYTVFQPAPSSPAWSCTPGGAAGSTCSAALGTLAAGATASLAFVVKVISPLPAGAASIANTACASSPAGPPLLAPVCDTVTTPTQGHPRLLLAKQYLGGPLLPGAVLSFDLDLANAGDQDAAAVALQETVPAHATFDAGASSAGWSCAGTAPGAACSLLVGALAAGAHRHATFAVTADRSLPPATVIGNAACATSAGGGSACGNASTPPELATDTTLAVTPRAIDVAGGVANPGDTLQYTLVVPNTTAAALKALVSRLTLDPHETLVAGSVATDHGAVTTGNAPGDATVVVTLGDLAPGQSATITFACRIASDLPAGRTVIAAQAQTTGANVPGDASDDPATPQIDDDPTVAEVTVEAPPPPPGPPPGGPQAIPTLGGWGVLTLGAGLAAAGLSLVRQRRGATAALAGPGAGERRRLAGPGLAAGASERGTGATPGPAAGGSEQATSAAPGLAAGGSGRGTSAAPGLAAGGSGRGTGATSSPVRAGAGERP
jgi:uncharacterized repeat protein (TIGR01451 family)